MPCLQSDNTPAAPQRTHQDSGGGSYRALGQSGGDGHVIRQIQEEDLTKSLGGRSSLLYFSGNLVGGSCMKNIWVHQAFKVRENVKNVWNGQNVKNGNETTYGNIGNAQNDVWRWQNLKDLKPAGCFDGLETDLKIWKSPNSEAGETKS